MKKFFLFFVAAIFATTLSAAIRLITERDLAEKRYLRAKSDASMTSEIKN